MTEPADAAVKKGVSIEPADASKLAIQASNEKRFSWKGETIGPATPVIGKALHASEVLSRAFSDQLVEIERHLVDTVNKQRRLHGSPAQL